MPDQSLQEKLGRVQQRMADLGYPIVVTETDRSQARQEQLYAQGRSAPGPVVTQTQHSQHSTGRAADLAFSVGGKASYAENLPWALLGKVAREEGLEWGGDWKSQQDRPHVQLPGGSMTPQENDYEVTDAKGRVIVMTGAKEPTKAEIDQAFADTFPENATPALQGGPVERYFKGLKDNAVGLAQGIPTMAAALLGIPAAQSQVGQGLAEVGGEALSGHPIKAATRLAGGDPDKIYNDYQAGNYAGVAGDVTLPVAMAALGARGAPAGVGEAVGTAARGAVRIVPTATKATMRGVGSTLSAAADIPKGYAPSAAIGGMLMGHPGAATAALEYMAARPAMRYVGGKLSQWGAKEPSLAATEQIGTGNVPANIRLATPPDTLSATVPEPALAPTSMTNTGQPIRFAGNPGFSEPPAGPVSAALSKIEAAKEGLTPSTTVSEGIDSAGRSTSAMRTTYRKPPEEQGAGFLKRQLDPMHSDEELAAMLAEQQPRPGTLIRPPKDVLTTNAATLPEPPPINPDEEAALLASDTPKPPVAPEPPVAPTGQLPDQLPEALKPFVQPEGEAPTSRIPSATNRAMSEKYPGESVNDEVIRDAAKTLGLSDAEADKFVLQHRVSRQDIYKAGTDESMPEGRLYDQMPDANLRPYARNEPDILSNEKPTTPVADRGIAPGDTKAYRGYLIRHSQFTDEIFIEHTGRPISGGFKDLADAKATIDMLTKK